MQRFSFNCARVVALAVMVAGLMATTANAETFVITIENLSPNVLTPAPFITHEGGVTGFNLFDEGAAASSELEMLAEDGITTGVVDLATAALGDTVLDFGVAGGAPIGPGGSAMVTLEADMTANYLSFASMLAISNDAFIGGADGDGAIDLFPGGSPFSGTVMIWPADVWDAGTEINDELAAHVPALGGGGAGVDEGGLISRPHGGIVGDMDIPIEADWTGGAVARITIVPEPGTLTIVGLFGSALLLRRRKRIAGPTV